MCLAGAWDVCRGESKRGGRMLGKGNRPPPEDVILDTRWHVRQRQPKELGVPACGIAATWPDRGHGVLHAEDHLHQVSVSVVGETTRYQLHH